MPLDRFYGGTGLDILYPIPVMNNHDFSEPEWDPSHLVRLISFSAQLCVYLCIYWSRVDTDQSEHV